MNWIQGDRVCSCIRGYYKGIPGTIKGRCQMQDLSRNGWEYDVELDSGRTVRMNENDLERVTPEIEEAYRKRVEESDRITQRVKERNERRADDRRRHEEAVEARKRQAVEEEAQARRDEYETTQRQLREKRGREYGLRSLRR